MLDEIEIIRGKQHEIILTFDFARQNKKVSLMPELPVTIIY
ncbi:hypothetical protein BN1221_02732 [Brenneria goodwinii]|nr:hypothetical protein BN1221_02732 [Brenneria goodwinii]